MKDRFKFRAWNKAKKELVYGAEQTDFYLGGIANKNSFFDLLNDDNYIVEQCTGIKDKNDTLIYEGDIVRVSADALCMSSICNGKLAEVRWDEGFGITFYFHFINSADLWNECADYEIVGNIHENPELVEDK